MCVFVFQTTTKCAVSESGATDGAVPEPFRELPFPSSSTRAARDLLQSLAISVRRFSLIIAHTPVC